MRFKFLFTNRKSGVLAILPAATLLCCSNFSQAAATNQTITVTNILAKPLSLEDTLNIALRNNAAILKAKNDLEATEGIIMQTRAIAMPKLGASGNFIAHDPDAIETFPAPGVSTPLQNWTTQIQITQSIYEGGRVKAALRAAKLTKEQSIANYDTIIADTMLAVQVTYSDVLLALQQIEVQESSIKLLSKELEDTKHRFDAGTVPKFNVLRAEVELANAKPRLIRAKNAYRIAKNNLANILGYNLPKDTTEDVPLQLSGKLDAEPYDIELPVAIGKALERRTELIALRKAQGLQLENITNVKSGYKPSVQLLGGYGMRNSSFSDNLAHEVHGWFAGAQASWNFFDGGLTRGRVIEAEANYLKSKVDVDDASRRVELEVRTDYSNFIEAKEVLESQKKVQEQAEESLRLAEARFGAGTATQTDVLSAQTALTDARSTQVQALHDYSVARARLDRAIGQITKTASAPSH